jgi:hypothetical protein
MSRTFYIFLWAMTLSIATAAGCVVTWEISAFERLAPARDRTLAHPLQTATTVSPVAFRERYTRDSADVESWVSTALARPLFSPDRRPVSSSTASASNTTRHLPRLAGIVISSESRRAIFSDGPKPIVVNEGDHIEGYIVRSITAREVYLATPHETQVLRPTFQRTARDTPSGGGSGSGSPPSSR